MCNNYIPPSRAPNKMTTRWSSDYLRFSHRLRRWRVWCTGSIRLRCSLWETSVDQIIVASNSFLALSDRFYRWQPFHSGIDFLSSYYLSLFSFSPFSDFPSRFLDFFVAPWSRCCDRVRDFKSLTPQVFCFSQYLLFFQLFQFF